MHFWSMSFWCYKLVNGELTKSTPHATVADTVKNAWPDFQIIEKIEKTLIRGNLSLRGNSI